MRILYTRMPGYDWVSVPSDAVARELVALGNIVTTVSDTNYVPMAHYDIVWSPYESVVLLGSYYSLKYDIPFYAHIEWLPPWRVLPNCDVQEYGFIGNEPELKDKGQQPYLLNIGKQWLNAQIKTIGSNFFKGYHKHILNDQRVEEAVPYLPSVDVQTILKAISQYNPKKVINRLITVARIVPNKRYDMIVRVLNELKTKVEWYVVGAGDINRVRAELTNTNVQLNYAGPHWGWTRYYDFLTSSVFIGSWSGIPPIEAALLGCTPVLIKPAETHENVVGALDELFCHEVPTFEHNEIVKAADFIDTLLLNQNDTTKAAIIEKFTNNKLGSRSSKEAAKQIITLVNNYYKR